ncbi:MAG: hypothetical protein II852_11895 [Bacteroidales bacterium]|jgi:hypothetical protein|nr:hypothetical protein [Bacteroidales bacterium]
MSTERYSNVGKGGIVKEGIFVRFPDLAPAGTDNYWNSKTHGKLIIVGESNYFEDDVDSVFKDPEAWYKGEDTKRLIPESMQKNVSNWKAGYKTFDNLCKAVNEILPDIHCDCIYNEAIYYNYFLRPATVKVVRGRRILTFKKDCTQIDREVAGDALCGIIETDKPNIVIFVSKYAYLEFKKYVAQKGYNLNVPFDFVNHPALPFSWNHKNGNGKQKFENLLQEYWISK